MGVWGSGNFEEDTAQEHLVETLQPLLQQIRDTVASEQAMQPDEYDSVAMMCNLEILSCLAEGLGPKQLPLLWPNVDEIRGWKAAYLRVWDACIDGLAPKPEFKMKRRAVIASTFDRFRAAVA